MELASMLAGEPFSDRPRCVDPVIAAYLRAFNDRLGHVERQRLYPYAAAAVGTTAGRAARRRRRDRCLAYAGLPRGPLGRLRIAMLLRLHLALKLDEGVAEYAARHAIASDDVEGGFALLDALLEAAPLAQPVVLGAQLGVAAAGAQLELDAGGPDQPGDAHQRDDERDRAGVAG
jgi:hypothetical protein